MLAARPPRRSFKVGDIIRDKYPQPGGLENYLNEAVIVVEELKSKFYFFMKVRHLRDGYEDYRTELDMKFTELEPIEVTYLEQPHVKEIVELAKKKRGV